MNPSPAANSPTAFDTLRARLMFLLGLVYLVLAAGLIHRTTSATVTEFEREVIASGLLVLWPFFLGEALWGVYCRESSQALGPVLLRAVLVCLLPPLRMALRDTRTGLIWVPRIGWEPPGKELSERLEHAFAGPMVIVALMILPVLALEYFRSEQVRHTPELALALDISVSVIWMAFAVEFIFRMSSHEKPRSFMLGHWLDLAIIVLPMLEFLLERWRVAPLARLLRAGQALSPEQLARMERLYRLRGVATEGWHALMLLNFVARLLGLTPEKRLKRIGERIAELQEEISELEKDASSLRERLKGTPPSEADQNQPETRSGGATGELPSAAATVSKQPSGP